MTQLKNYNRRMKALGWVGATWLFVIGMGAWAQLSPAPVLVKPPVVAYPPIARAAHVSGEVEVDFSIDSSGRTVDVTVVSGPAMLRFAVESQVRAWTFRTPLPTGAETSFRAKYRFGMSAAEEDLDDDLNAPPYIPCCGDSISLPASAGQIQGEVKSVDGSQAIDVTPGKPAAAPDRCPEGTNREVPKDSDGEDYVELRRFEPDYRVKVFRDGRVEWNGVAGVAVKGLAVGRMDPGAAEELVERFRSVEFWSRCPVDEIEAERDKEGDLIYAQYDWITESLGKRKLTANMNLAGEKLEWAVDRAADSHRWRHGDAATESWSNFVADLQLPKRGMTKLIRATYRWDSHAQLTVEPLKHFLAAGADVEAGDESGRTPLMYAAALTGRDVPTEKLLLEAHANPNAVSLHGETALMFGAYRGEFDGELVEAGAKLDMQNGDGVTALMLLVEHENFEEIEKMLKAGANAGMHDREGRTALDYLSAAGCGKAIVPLPLMRGWVQVDKAVCPPVDENYLRMWRLLERALVKSKTAP